MNHRESIVHGQMGFPVALYHLDRKHVRYFMNFHWHPECEIVRILEGRLELRLNRVLYTGKPGDVFFIPGGTFHSAVPHHCVYECLVFHLPLLLPAEDNGRKTADDLAEGRLPPKNPLPADADMNAIIAGLFDAMVNRCPGYNFTVKGLILQFVGKYLSDPLLFCERQGVDTPRQDDKLREILDYLEDNYAQPITLCDMAKVVGVTPNYFCRYFRTLTNTSPMEYLIGLRVEEAAHRLVTTDQSVLEIALSCGFNDASHFTHTFRSIKKETPSRYRKSAHDSVTRISQTGNGKDAE